MRYRFVPNRRFEVQSKVGMESTSLVNNINISRSCLASTRLVSGPPRSKTRYFIILKSHYTAESECCNPWPGRFSTSRVEISSFNPILVLYPTYFHSPPPFAHHFPPVPPAPVGRPRPPRADRSRSGFTQGQRGPRVVYATVNVARAGKPRPPLVCCQNC